MQVIHRPSPPGQTRDRKRPEQKGDRTRDFGGPVPFLFGPLREGEDRTITVGLSSGVRLASKQRKTGEPGKAFSLVRRFAGSGVPYGITSTSIFPWYGPNSG